MAGRRPKPTAAKQLAGNPGKRPLNYREPQPDIVSLPCPRLLVGEARAEWERLAPELTRLGILTAIDEKALMGYCQTWARWIDAEQKIAKFGSVVKGPNDYPVQSPYLKIAVVALDQMRKYMVEFGLTPSSRSRLHVAAKKETSNAFAEIAADRPTIQ